MALKVGIGRRFRALTLLARGNSRKEVAKEMRRRYHPKESETDVEKAYFSTSRFGIGRFEGKPREEILEFIGQTNKHIEKLRKRVSSEEVKQKSRAASSVALRERWQDPEFRKRNTQRARKQMAALWEDLDFRDKMRQVGLNNQNVPARTKAQRQRVSEGAKRRVRTPEGRKQMKALREAAAEKMRTDPEARARVVESSRRIMTLLNQLPGFREATRERMRKKHKDPAFRRKMAESRRKYWEVYRSRFSDEAERQGYRNGVEFDRETGKPKDIAVVDVTPRDKLMGRELESALERALSELQPDERRIVTALFFHGQTDTQLATDLGVPLVKVKRTKKKALKKMARHPALLDLK